MNNELNTVLLCCIMISEPSKANKLSNLTYKVSKTSLSQVGVRASGPTGVRAWEHVCTHSNKPSVKSIGVIRMRDGTNKDTPYISITWTYHMTTAQIP